MWSKKRAKCKICCRTIARSRGNITYSYKHLKNHQPQQYVAFLMLSVDEQEATAGSSQGQSKQTSIQAASASILFSCLSIHARLFHKSICFFHSEFYAFKNIKCKNLIAIATFRKKNEITFFFIPIMVQAN